MHAENLLNFPVPSPDATALSGLAVAEPQPASSPHMPDHPTLPEQLAEARVALHAETMSALEIEIMAALWTYHPRPLRVSEICLAVRSSSDAKLKPFTTALKRFVQLGLLRESALGSFDYQLTRDGVLAAVYLAIAGVSGKFHVAKVCENHAAIEDTCGADRLGGAQITNLLGARSTGAPSPLQQQRVDETKTGGVGPECGEIAQPRERSMTAKALGVGALEGRHEETSNVDCHTGCGRIAADVCECGNGVCSSHRYNAHGQHDPAGTCSICYEEILTQG